MMTQFILGQQPAEEGQQQPSMAPMFILGVVVLFVMMVMFPASRRQRKEQEKLIASLKRGIKVLTTGGIVGTIVSAKDGEDEIVIRSEDTRMRIKRTAVSMILGSDEAEANKS
jgi:preprotein translocase subunit YajC